ncbi:SRPBCC family protein [Marinifilum sp.]|uniref:SRPBCC family protein n=1 Tax=Marinifilum sp. TaxID=2033137 RepID=UPI003BAB7BD2
MSYYQFYKEQLLQASIDEIWNFISRPANLKEITPDYMGFNILSENLPDQMYAGMIISYQVNPFPWYSTKWVTEITQVKELEFFIDEQRIGPYNLWHHQHILEQSEEGVLMKDIITYQPPMAFLGSIANELIIKKTINQIFNYRQKVLDLKFNASKKMEKTELEL